MAQTMPVKHKTTAQYRFEAKVRYYVSLIPLYITLILISIYILSPLVVVVFSAFKTLPEYLYQVSAFQPPQSFTNFENFSSMAKWANLPLAFFNSFLQVSVSTFFYVFMSSMVAFVLTRFQFPLKGLVIGLYLLMNIVPMIVVEVARYKMIAGIKGPDGNPLIFNTPFAGFIIYMAADVLAIYIYIQAMKNIPISLDESAMMDGASYFKIYWSIILPLVRPATTTVIILKVINVYNDFYGAYLYLPGPAVRTATKAVSDVAGDITAKFPILAAGCLMLMLPTLIIYLLLQKWIISGMISGASKE